MGSTSARKPWNVGVLGRALPIFLVGLLATRWQASDGRLWHTCHQAQSMLIGLTESVMAELLGLQTSTNLSEEHLAAIRKIDQYDLSFVAERLIRKQLLPEPAVSQAIVELKRFFALAIMEGPGLPMTSLEVDEVWHNFILHTFDYSAFCQDVFGRFLHHQPGSPTSKPFRPFNEFIALYERHFGTLAPTWGLLATGGVSSSNCGGQLANADAFGGVSSNRCTVTVCE